MTDYGAIILSAVLGGLVFSFAQNWAWRLYTKPIIRIAGSASASFETGPENDITHRVFRIPVRNTGRTAAYNCKPELRMKGQRGDSEYEVNQQLTWSESNNPTRITINANERAEFDLLRIASEESDGPIEVPPTFYVELPGNDQWGGEDSITVWEYEDGRAVDVSVPDKIEKSEFSGINWKPAEITITAENADKKCASIQFELGSEHGMVGMAIKTK